MVEQEVIDCMNDMIKTVIKREKSRQYYLNNRNKVLKQQKEYQEKTKDKKREYQKEYRNENKDKIKQKGRQYYIENKDKINQKQKEYYKTDAGLKSNRICSWRKQGIICDNWDALYDHYLKTSFCDICKVQLTYDSINTATTKCVDHDHSITDRPNFRSILCNCCNLNRRSD